MCEGGGGNLSFNVERLSRDDRNTKQNCFFAKRQLLFEKLNIPKDFLRVSLGLGECIYLQSYTSQLK